MARSVTPLKIPATISQGDGMSPKAPYYREASYGITSGSSTPGSPSTKRNGEKTTPRSNISLAIAKLPPKLLGKQYANMEHAYRSFSDLNKYLVDHFDVDGIKYTTQSLSFFFAYENTYVLRTETEEVLQQLFCAYPIKEIEMTIADIEDNIYKQVVPLTKNIVQKEGWVNVYYIPVYAPVGYKLRIKIKLAMYDVDPDVVFLERRILLRKQLTEQVQDANTIQDCSTRVMSSLMME